MKLNKKSLRPFSLTVLAASSCYLSANVREYYDGLSKIDEENAEAAITAGASSVLVAEAMLNGVNNRLLDLRNGVDSQNSVGLALGGSKGGLIDGGVPYPLSETSAWDFSLWGGVYYQNTDLDSSRNSTLVEQPGVDLDIFGGDVGIDLQVTSDLLLGFAFGFAHADVDLASIDTGFESDTFKLNPYFLYTREMGPGKLFVDGQYAYGFGDVENDGLDEDASFHQIEFRAGYLFQSNIVNHGPVVSARYLDGEIENVVLGNSDFNYESFSFRVGYTASKRMALGQGYLQPSVTASWERQTDEEQASLGGADFGVLDENLFIINAGANYSLNHLNVGLHYEGRFGDIETTSFVGLNAGLNF